MASDIVPMPDEEMVCPYCERKVLLKWQLAVYDDGDSPQFIGLEKKPEEIRLPPLPDTRNDL